MDRVIYFVVGDVTLNSGNGIEVENLEEMKERLMKMHPQGEWQLVISIHGAEDVIATRGGNLKNRQEKGVYDADDMRKLFGDDTAFKKWRDDHGPTWTTLNACQVNLPFEAVIIQSFNKPKTKQNAQGLGKGCRPATEIMEYYKDPKDKKTRVKTRQQWRRLSRSEQADIKSTLSELNKKFGYFGGPPVDESLLLEYYFDEEPKGGWPVVTVSHERADTGISFYNRTQNARFLGEKCTEHIGPLRPHRPTMPPAP
jgi:hypothetical protein